MKRWYVMQTTETGEAFCVFSNTSEDKCFDWIDENENNFPESSFFLECR